MLLGVALVRIETEAMAAVMEHDEIRVAGAGTGAQGDVGLAKFHPHQLLGGDHAAGDGGKIPLHADHGAQQGDFEAGQGGDDQLTRRFVLPVPGATQPLGQFVICAAANFQQFLPDIGGRVAALVALEQLRAQLGLQRVDMAEDGGTVHAQRVSRRRDRAQLCHHVGAPDFRPCDHTHPRLLLPFDAYIGDRPGCFNALCSAA